MPLTDDDVIHSNSGTSTSTSFTVSLAGADTTTAGNTILVFITSLSAGVTLHSSFANDSGGSAFLVARYSNCAAGESSWAFTQTSAVAVEWYVEEVQGLDVEPLDVSTTGSNGTCGDGGTIASSTSSRNVGLSVKAYAFFECTKASGDTASFDSYTNGFEEVNSVPGTSLGIHQSVARLYVDGTTQTFQCTATRHTTGAAGGAAMKLVVYRSANATVSYPLWYCTGFEYGTHGGMGNNLGNNPHAGALGGTGTWGTNYLIQAGSARNSGYGLRISVSAANSSVGLGTLSSAGGAAVGFNCRVVSATGTVTVFSLGSTTARLVYDATNSKFGLQWGSGGTPAWQSGTTAINTWVWVDIRARVNSSTWHADWRLETGANTYTDQTSPADLTGQTPGTVPAPTLSVSAVQTMVVDYDDVVTSRYYSAYPLTPHEVRVLVPTTTGASVVGTSTNFSEFTANGTLAAFASTSGQRIDEVPPTVSASSDGVVQTTVATSDYMVFPMTDPSLASDEVFAAGRAVIPTWGGTGTGTGTLWLAVSDGTTETVIDAGSAAYDGDSLTAVSSTYPFWRQGMITAPAGGWTASKANALEARVGKSSDATPDMGVSAFYIEYARRKAVTIRQVTVEDPISATVDLRVNPYNSASVSYVVTNNDATRSVNFNYSLAGTPQTPVTVGPSANQTVPVSADAFGDVSDLSVEPI